MQSAEAPCVGSSIVVVPSRVPCRVRRSSEQRAVSFFHKASLTLITPRFAVLSVWQSSMEVFVLLKNEEAGSDAEVEFTGENQTLRVRPVRWNERILCVSAPGGRNNTERKQE